MDARPAFSHLAPHLAIDGLDHHYGSAQSLRGVSLSIRRGECVALLGRNGAGKTTLLRCLAGLLRPSAGHILLDGADIGGWAGHRRCRGGIGYVPQGREIFSDLSVAENLVVAYRAQRRTAHSGTAHAAPRQAASPHADAAPPGAKQAPPAHAAAGTDEAKYAKEGHAGAGRAWAGQLAASHAGAGQGAVPHGAQSAAPGGDSERAVLEEVFALFPVLREMGRRRGGDLSGGQQQQLAIGRALMGRPRLLVLDEPTEGIQPSVVKAIEAAITTLKSRMSILLVEQYLDFAGALADRYVVLSRGAVVAQGPGADLHGVDNRRAELGRFLSV